MAKATSSSISQSCRCRCKGILAAALGCVVPHALVQRKNLNESQYNLGPGRSLPKDYIEYSAVGIIAKARTAQDR